MRERDKAILRDLERFRVMSRDDIAELHFPNIKNAVKCCNTVLKRMRRDGHIEANTTAQPYLYFPSPASIKKDSQKIPHFLSILQVYKQLLHYEKPKALTIEPKYGKGYMEPDMFAIWKGSPLFIEVQRSIYSERVMEEKIQRYERYFYHGEWKEEAWQNEQRKVFPMVVILTDTRYAVSSENFRIYQVQSMNELLLQTQVGIQKKSIAEERQRAEKTRSKPQQQPSGIRIMAGSNLIQR